MIILWSFISSYSDEIQLGFENPDTKVRIVSIGCMRPVEAGQRLSVGRGKITHLVTSIRDLEGYVSIENTWDALKFVRLITSPETEYMWGAGQRTMEVISTDMLVGMPKFGTDMSLHLLSPSTFNHGYGGVLDPQAFKSGHFAPARIKRVGSTYEIRRWVISTQNSNSAPKVLISYIKEVVEKNGRYSQFILSKKPLPNLSNTFWQFPIYQ